MASKANNHFNILYNLVHIYKEMLIYKFIHLNFYLVNYKFI